MERPFHSIYSHGFIRTAVCVPRLRVADPGYNAEQTIRLAEQASAMSAAVTVFPELGLSAYANDDLFHQDALLDSAMEAVSRVADASRDLTPVLVVGAPLRFDAALFNCAVVIYRGEVLGIVPKSYLPNYAEFYEKRQFTRRRRRAAGRGAFSKRRRTLRKRSDFRDPLPGALCAPRGVMRGLVGAYSSEYVCGAGRGLRAG